MVVERSKLIKWQDVFCCHKLNTFVCTQSPRGEKASVLGEFDRSPVPATYRLWDFVLSGGKW